MKDIRIFIASSKELERERNYLAYLVLAKEDKFATRGLRVRLAKWEYVDPKMTEARTEDRYLDEMYNCDAALVLFRDIAGMYTREELDRALAREQAGSSRLKTHQILFAADGKPDEPAAKLRESMPPDSYGVWSGMDELRAAFLSLVDKVAQYEELVDAPSDKYVRKITAFLAADGELEKERNAFADTVLNVNDLLEQAHRNIRVQLKFYDPANAESVIESSEMGLVLYGTNYRMFGSEEIKRIYERVKDGTQNPKCFYVFFRDLDEAAEKSLDEAFKTFRSDFVSKLGHFTCQFGDANALRLGFLLSLERYAGESIEIYSTVSAPTTSVFVGRENELRRLCELLEPVPGKFPAGRLPIITGAGGTGKSELVRQYASQFRVQYPGGVFLVDMEHVKTWDETFLGILNGTPNNGSKVEDYLDLKEAEGSHEERPKELMTGAKVRDALLRRARESGPVLLVLDNVEGCMSLLGRDGGFRKAFPAGFSERVRVNVVATARVCDMMLRPTDWAVQFPLGDLSQNAALEVLLADRPEADAAERKAAGRVAELLGYRALYLRRVPALIGDLYAQTVCDSYAELAKALEENLLATVAEETEDAHLPGVLWNMTRERLLKMPFGAECVKLVQAASFFSPDGFPQHVLKYLWKTIIAPNLDEKKFVRVLEIIKHHNVFQSIDPVRIHRLDRAAILQTARDEIGLEETIGKALSVYPGMSAKDWIGLAESETIVKCVPECHKSGDFYGSLLLSNPNLKLVIDNVFAYISLEDWVKLLIRQPRFAQDCPWEKFSGEDWRDLLIERPQFADRCRWLILSGRDWCALLRVRPEFGDKCNWDALSNRDWLILLEYQPQFSVHCPWERIKANKGSPVYGTLLWAEDWLWLLEKQPQFSEHCPWQHLPYEYSYTNALHLLRKQPQFLDRCPGVQKFSDKDWCSLIEVQPQLVGRCKWDVLKGYNWAGLLSATPQFADNCEWNKLNGSDWARLLSAQPQFADRCSWDKLSGQDWARLLTDNPQFAQRCEWDKLKGSDWAGLLLSQPQFADRCDWEKLEGDDWARLLVSQSQFAKHCNWEKLSAESWLQLLKARPNFASNCQWALLYERRWRNSPMAATMLLIENPRFYVYCDWTRFSGSDWAILLMHQPQLSCFCDWGKLDGRDWGRLLRHRPFFSKYCDWSKLDGADWIDMLKNAFQDPGNQWYRADPELTGYNIPLSRDISEKIGQALEERNGYWTGISWIALESDFREIFMPFDRVCFWAGLLARYPEYAMYCSSWDKFDGWSACMLLMKQPQFANKFDMASLGDETASCWTKPDIEHSFEYHGDPVTSYGKPNFRLAWKKLLAVQPQFAKYLRNSIAELL